MSRRNPTRADIDDLVAAFADMSINERQRRAPTSHRTPSRRSPSPERMDIDDLVTDFAEMSTNERQRRAPYRRSPSPNRADINDLVAAFAGMSTNERKRKAPTSHRSPSRRSPSPKRRCMNSTCSRREEPNMDDLADLMTRSMSLRNRRGRYVSMGRSRFPPGGY